MNRIWIELVGVSSICVKKTSESRNNRFTSAEIAHRLPLVTRS